MRGNFSKSKVQAMGRTFRNTSFFFVFLGVISCSQVEKSNEPTTTGNAGWSAQMQKMSAALKKAVPFVYSRIEFRKEQNKTEILRAIGDLKSAAHKIPKEDGEKMIGKDPLINFSARNIHEDLALAEQSFSAGQFDFAQHTMKAVVATCFGCHSSRDYGPQFVSFENFPTQFQYSPSEKAEVFVATRQFDKGAEILEETLKDPYNYYEFPFEQERALNKFLVLMIRVKKDPARANQVLTKFLQKANIPVYLREYVEHWQQALGDWKKNDGQSPEKLVGNLKKAIDKKANVFGREATTVENLRLTNVLHETLGGKKRGQDLANIYKDLGEAYESISELGFWNLPEVYYEACVREMPKTEIAKRCFKGYERVTILHFSGSAGTFLPEDERARIKELKAIAGI